MVKILFLIVFVSLSYGITSLELAKNIVNSSNKRTQLELLFTNQNYQDSKGNLDIEKISNMLKANSLLNLILPAPETLRLNFKAQTDFILFFEIINNALNNAGYVYFIPTDLVLRDGNIDYTIQVESQYILDPGVFYRLLKENSVYINNIKKVGLNDYEYDLNFDEARLKTNANINLNTATFLEKPLQDYIILLKGATLIKIDANDTDEWFPKILFLDKNLNLIKSIKSQVKNNHFSEFIPDGSMYAIISDVYSLDNIKRGLKIYLKK